MEAFEALFFMEKRVRNYSVIVLRVLALLIIGKIDY
jgi:hypothetical protein